MSLQTIVLPQHGASMTDAYLVEWSVQVGDHIEAGATLCTVEAAKAQMDIECPYTGTIVSLEAEVDDNVSVGEPLATIEIQD